LEVKIMSYCDYLEAKILDDWFGKQGNTVPATLYLGVCTGITEAGVITGEPTGANYSRVSITNNSTNFPAASGGSKANGVAFTFPEASGSWGASLTKFFFSDSASGNTNTLAYGDLTVPKTIGVGDTLKFNIGDLTFTLD
jgi:hypothetical protein